MVKPYIRARRYRRVIKKSKSPMAQLADNLVGSLAVSQRDDAVEADVEPAPQEAASASTSSSALPSLGTPSSHDPFSQQGSWAEEMAKATPQEEAPATEEPSPNTLETVGTCVKRSSIPPGSLTLGAQTAALEVVSTSSDAGVKVDVVIAPQSSQPVPDTKRKETAESSASNTPVVPYKIPKLFQSGGFEDKPQSSAQPAPVVANRKPQPFRQGGFQQEPVPAQRFEGARDPFPPRHDPRPREDRRQPIVPPRGDRGRVAERQQQEAPARAPEVQRREAPGPRRPVGQEPWWGRRLTPPPPPPPQHQPGPDQPPCVFCSGRGHYSAECIVRRRLSVRADLLIESGLCSQCLTRHHSDCMRADRCLFCQDLGHHQTVCVTNRYVIVDISTTATRFYEDLYFATYRETPAGRRARLPHARSRHRTRSRSPVQEPQG